MLGTKIIINITRKTDNIDRNTQEYIEQVIYSNLEAKMIEVKNEDFKTNISQTEPIQKLVFGIEKDKTAVKIGDNITYNDVFGSVKAKITTRPKMIEFEESENFIKLTAELIGV